MNKISLRLIPLESLVKRVGLRHLSGSVDQKIDGGGSGSVGEPTECVNNTINAEFIKNSKDNDNHNDNDSYTNNSYDSLDDEPITINSPKFYRHRNNELRKYHGLMPLKDNSLHPLSNLLINKSHQHNIELEKCSIYVQTIVDTLLSMRMSLSESNTDYTTILQRKYTSKPLPKFPNYWTKELLIDYLKTITEYYHTNSKYSSQIGLISLIVNDLLRVNNPSTMNYLSTDAFNIGISYHIRNKDLRSARQIYQDMLSSGISVNTDTFNLLLIASRHRLNDKWSIHPLKVIDGYLKQMRIKGIPINIDTWNIILCTVPEGSNKAKILMEMSKKNIPISKRGLACCVQDILDQVGPKLTMIYLEKQLKEYDIGIDTINTVISGILREGESDKVNDEDQNESKLPKSHQPYNKNYSNNDITEKVDIAWKYLHYALKKWNLKPTTNVLNTFGKYFAERGDINRFLGIYSTMTSKYNIKPSCVTYQYMIESAVRSRFHKYKYELIEILYSISSQVPRTKTSQVWILRAKSQFQYYSSQNLLSKATFKLTKIPAPEHKLLFNQIQHLLKWDELSYKPINLTNISPELKISKLLNLFPTAPNYNPQHHKIASRKFFSNITKQHRTKTQQQETNLKEQLIKNGPYEKYVNDLTKEGLINH